MIDATTYTNASTPQTGAEMAAKNNFLRAWRSATSNILKYFQESKRPPSTHELEAVTRFINTITSDIEMDIKKCAAKKKSSSKQSIKQLEETSDLCTSGNTSKVAVARSHGCLET